MSAAFEACAEMGRKEKAVFADFSNREERGPGQDTAQGHGSNGSELEDGCPVSSPCTPQLHGKLCGEKLLSSWAMCIIY